MGLSPKMGPKGPKGNLAADRSLRRMRVSYGRDAPCAVPGGARGLIKNAFSNPPIGMVLIDLDGCWLQIYNALCRPACPPMRFCIIGHALSDVAGCSRGPAHVNESVQRIFGGEVVAT